MIIKGKTRGNGKQLAEYLMSWGENEKQPQVLELKQTPANDIHKSLLRMSLLSGDAKGLYHTTLNPESQESYELSPKDWQKAADILEKHLKLEGLPRVIVLHEKKGRVHAHVVWQRFDPNLGKLRSDQFDKYRSSDARLEIERVLDKTRTPERHTQKRDVKAELTTLWQESKNAQEFREKAEALGYILARGEARRPFKVIAPDGQSLDLVRQLKGITTEQVRQRLKGIEKFLPSERKAVAQYGEQKKQLDYLKESENAETYIVDKILAEAMQSKVTQEQKFKPFKKNSKDETENKLQGIKVKEAANDNTAPKQAEKLEATEKFRVFQENAKDQSITFTEKKFLEYLENINVMISPSKQKTIDDYLKEAGELLAKNRERGKGYDLER